LDYLAEIKHPRATRFYGWLYTISKAYMHYKRIYPIKYSFKEKLQFFKEMMNLDFFKHFKEKKRGRDGSKPKN